MIDFYEEKTSSFSTVEERKNEWRMIRLSFPLFPGFFHYCELYFCIWDVMIEREDVYYSIKGCKI
jgi:hypothetical protein